MVEELSLENINLEEKVVVRNLCSWDLYFARINSVGDVKISQNGSIRLSREEIQSQTYAGNRLFVGSDGAGKNARIYIEDAKTRALVGFDTGEEKQTVLNKDTLSEIFKIKNKKDFEASIEENVQTHAEKFSVIEYARKTNFNDNAKIKFLEEHTGFKFETEVK